MTSAQVEDLLCRAAGALCVRYQPTSDGHVVTLDYQQANPHKHRWFAWAIPTALATVAAGFLQFGPPIVTTRTMGAVCPTSRPSTAPLPTPSSSATTCPTDPGNPASPF
jgi:hypothetical protein